jgi:hypothetical protein
MKQSVEDRKQKTSIERGLESIAETQRKLDRLKQFEESEAQMRNELSLKLVESKSKYKVFYDEALAKNDENRRVIFKDLLTLVDNIDGYSDRLSISDMESLLPNDDGMLDIDEIKKVIASVSSFVRVNR